MVRHARRPGLTTWRYGPERSDDEPAFGDDEWSNRYQRVRARGSAELAAIARKWKQGRVRMIDGLSEDSLCCAAIVAAVEECESWLVSE